MTAESTTTYKIPKFWKKAKLEVRKPMLRSSMVYNHQTCPRKFMYSDRLGLRRKGEYSPALETGTTTHELIGALFQGIPIENLPIIANDRIRQIEQRLIKETGESAFLPNGRTVTEVLREIDQSTAMALAMVRIWNRHAPVANVLKRFDIVSVEKHYDVQLPGIKSLVRIKPDVLLREKTSNAYWIVDHKTTSVSPVLRASVLQWEIQPRLYIWALEAHLQKLRVADPRMSAPVLGGYIHNLLRKCTLRFSPTGKDKERGFEGYVERVNEWYQEQELKDAEDPVFVESTVLPRRPLANPELIQALKGADKAARSPLNLDRFYRVADACHKYNRTCPYFRLCTESEAMLPRVIDAAYVQSFREDEEGEPE